VAVRVGQFELPTELYWRWINGRAALPGQDSETYTTAQSYARLQAKKDDEQRRKIFARRVGNFLREHNGENLDAFTRGALRALLTQAPMEFSTLEVE
jgi:hypothetical protein